MAKTLADRQRDKVLDIWLLAHCITLAQLIIPEKPGAPVAAPLPARAPFTRSHETGVFPNALVIGADREEFLPVGSRRRRLDAAPSTGKWPETNPIGEMT